MGFSKASTQRWLAFAAVLTTAFALLPATGGEARKETCAVRGSHTHLQTKSLRVFSIFRGSNTGAGSSKYFACYRKTGRKTKIGVQNGPEQVYTDKPAGRLLPYQNSLENTTGDRRGDSSRDHWTARLLDVRSGKLEFAFSILFKDGTAGGLVATPSGGIAFILVEFIPEDDETDGKVVSIVGHKAGTGKHAYTRLTPRYPANKTELTGKGDVVSWRIRDESRLPISFITGSANLGR